MNNLDIIDGLSVGLENVLFKQWRHSGYIDLMHSDKIYFCVDGKYYIVELKEETKEQFKNRHKSAEDYIKEYEESNELE